ncbi:MAG: NAD-dependent succinate-semialdehyde dehydrogenase [Anaerolineae bacterium]|nr:NAD-dependent succinate-semialdehyde dehydrogenase [Anaerolineae bacterium]
MKFYLAGQWQDRSDVIEVVNPYDGQVVDTVPRATADDVESALVAATAGAKVMAQLPAYERFKILRQATDLMRARTEDLAQTISREEGKTLAEARGEVSRSAQTLELSGEEAKRLSGEVLPLEGGEGVVNKLGFTLRVPCGVVAAITPFNFPLNLVCHKVGPAIAAGNAVILKPASDTPLVAMKLVEILLEAGLPSLAISCITGGGREIGETLCRDPRVRKISFTGSTRVGKLLMDGASRTVTKLALEMGGNAPVLIFPDVDVEEVAKTAVGSKYRNNGQVCIAPQRFYVHSRIAEEFIDHATRFSQGLCMGSGLEPATDVGPLINAIQRERLEQMVTEATHQGAEVLTGGARPEDFPRGYFYKPTVMVNLKPDMAVYREELFGPVMPIIPFADPDEAIALANGLEAGLAAYVQTRDLATAIHAYEKLDYGMVGINEWMPVTPEAPFGGMKASGIGRESGTEGMHEYLESKAVYIGGL